MAYGDVNYSLQRNPLVVPALLLAMGIVVGSWLRVEPWIITVVLVLIIGVSFVVKQPINQTRMLYLSVFVLGMMLFSVSKPRENRLSPPNAVQQWVDEQFRMSGIRQHELLTAMTTGKSEATHDAVKEIRHNYSTAGVGHLLALSGLHVGFFYTMVLLLTMRRKHSALVQVLVLSCVWMYVLLTGAAASTVRAGVMVTLHAMALMLYREPLPFNQMSLAAILIFVISPMQLFDVGFILSFGAVIAIFLYMPLIMPKVENRIVQWLCASVCLSVSAQIGVAPVMSHVFGQATPYFLISNLIVVPIAMLVIYGAFAILLLTPFPLLQHCTAKGVSFLLDEMDSFIGFVANLPGADVRVNINLTQTICCYVSIVAIALLIKVIRD